MTAFGQIAHHAIAEIEQHYSDVKADHYVVMPNHVHILLVLDGKSDHSVSTIINQFKGIVSKRCGMKIWQSRFYDHIIRDEEDYLSIWQYIDNNPAKWQEDMYYV